MKKTFLKSMTLGFATVALAASCSTAPKNAAHKCSTKHSCNTKVKESNNKCNAAKKSNNNCSAAKKADTK